MARTRRWLVDGKGWRLEEKAVELKEKKNSSDTSMMARNIPTRLLVASCCCVDATGKMNIQMMEIKMLRYLYMAG